MGVNYFGQILGEAVTRLGISGNITPHSLRATAITDLFRSKKLIKEAFGHKSDAVDTYAHTSKKQKKRVQGVLIPKNDEKEESIHEMTMTQKIQMWKFHLTKTLKMLQCFKAHLLTATLL
jgi:hypothetical protein